MTPRQPIVEHFADGVLAGSPPGFLLVAGESFRTPSSTVRFLQPSVLGLRLACRSMGYSHFSNAKHFGWCARLNRPLKVLSSEN
jgi:hypothetical protein